MDPRKQSVVFVILGGALLLLLVVSILLYPSGGPDSLPEPLEELSPGPNSIVIPQTEIVIEIGVGYEIALVVDGIPIPASEIVGVSATGTFRWRPGPDSVIPTFTPGNHTIEVSWDNPSRPDPGVYTWTFRVT